MHFIYSLINLYIHECNCPFNFCHCLYIYTRLGKKNTKKNMLFNSFKDHLVVVHSWSWAPTVLSV